MPYEYRTAQVAKLIQKRKTGAAQQLDDQVKTIDAVAEECKTLNELKQKIENIFSDDNEGIVFSSIHKQKGGEADTVYILESKNMPHPMAEQHFEKVQECNICYVAITRAKKELYFVDAPIPFPKQFMI